MSQILKYSNTQFVLSYVKYRYIKFERVGEAWSRQPEQFNWFEICLHEELFKHTRKTSQETK